MTSAPFGVQGGRTTYNPLRIENSSQWHEFEYGLGSIYIGDNTLGATGAVILTSARSGGLGGTGYFKDVVPIRPADTVAGYAPIQDILKHYQRIEYGSIIVKYRPMAVSATDKGSIAFAPLAAGSSFTVSVTNDSPTYSFTDVVSCQGAKNHAMWEGFDLDLTPYMFERVKFIHADAASISQSLPSAQLTVPVSFVYAGVQNSMSAGVVGMVSVRVRCRFFDYLSLSVPFVNSSGPKELGTVCTLIDNKGLSKEAKNSKADSKDEKQSFPGPSSLRRLSTSVLRDYVTIDEKDEGPASARSEPTRIKSGK
jgi:hypothetical protein